MNLQNNLNYKKISLVLLIIVLLLTIPHFCNDSDRLQGQYDILKEQLSQQKELVKNTEEKRIKEKDSLNFLISQREVQNGFLADENTALRKKIKDINDKPILLPKDLVGLTRYFNERYKTTQNKVVDNKVGLIEEVAYDVSYELESGDRAEETVVFQDSIIKNQDTVIVNLNKDKVDLSLVISSAENELEQRKKLQEMSEDNIKNLENQVKKQKRKNVWNKILLGIGTMTSFYLGTRL